MVRTRLFPFVRQSDPLFSKRDISVSFALEEVDNYMLRKLLSQSILEKIVHDHRTGQMAFILLHQDIRKGNTTINTDVIVFDHHECAAEVPPIPQGHATLTKGFNASGTVLPISATTPRCRYHLVWRRVVPMRPFAKSSYSEFIQQFIRIWSLDS